MANKDVPGYTQVPIIQQDVRTITLVALNDAATVFQLTVDYNIKDSVGELRGTGHFSVQVATQPDATLINQILTAANAAQGT